MFDPTTLWPFYGAGPERIGFVLKDGQVVETQNVCHDPLNGFDFRGEDLLQYADDAHGAFHTHPDVSSNLTEEDRRSFLDYPDLVHYIVGLDGISCYEVKNGSVLLAASYPPPRVAEVDPPRAHRGQRRKRRGSRPDGDGSAARLPA